MDLYSKYFHIDEELIDSAGKIEAGLSDIFARIDRTAEQNLLKVLNAFHENALSDSHFAGTTGYGYDDRGREVLESVFASVFKSEDALVRHQIVSGTHAISICFFGNLRPGDTLLSITGKPYDTLEEVIGIRNAGHGSLLDFGIKYAQTELTASGTIDLDAVAEALVPSVKMVYIQRSRGYSSRRALTVEDIAAACKFIRSLKKDVIVMVDNCYGEFVQTGEPIEAGADLIAGSLIKNPGGGLAPSGGYVAGGREYVRNAAYSLTAPGIGKKVGATLGNSRAMFQGLYMAPHAVAQSLKGAVFCASLMKASGFGVSPEPDELRADIIQSVELGSAKRLEAFCAGIQLGSPVDSHVLPVPWDMPGYDCQVIMAAGGFVQGASVELSADAPMKPPYTVYLQGGLIYENVKLAALLALQKIKKV